MVEIDADVREEYWTEIRKQLVRGGDSLSSPYPRVLSVSEKSIFIIGDRVGGYGFFRFVRHPWGHTPNLEWLRRRLDEKDQLGEAFHHPSCRFAGV